ncbi:MAG: hypothetical protein DPW16_10045 [Chloroflexi bacterium]|nr:hypothetical protein [Chloroflexota bacterium]
MKGNVMEIARPNTLFDEIVEFLTSEPSNEQLLAFQPSEALKQRSLYLLEQNRNGSLTDVEQLELDEFRRMNHLVNMLKIRARQKLAAHE